MLRSAQEARFGASSVLGLLGSLAILAALYLARVVLIPFALALLLAFALTPAVVRLQRLRLRKALAVLPVVALALALAASIAWLVSAQLIDIASQFPRYRANIHAKLLSLHGPKDGVLARVSESIRQMGEEISSEPSKAPALRKKRVEEDTPTPVQVVQPPRNLLQSIGALLSPLLRPLETVGIVVIFTTFMLLERESLRNRLLRLVGQDQIPLATQALDDAASRVSRFLLMQLIVNSSYGALFAAGLWGIGVPNALLWGVLAALLRFIPYAGVLAAVAMPLALTLAAFDGWKQPLLLLGLFVLLEVTVANFVEPWVYGARTGISSLAILVAAVFWASLWGPVGLILSTPLTVCLVVLGRHVPHLEFLHILLGDEPVLLPEARFYQRLLALDQDEARSIVLDALKEQPLVEVYDKIVLPALSMAEQDRYRADLSETKIEFIWQSTSELVEELAKNGDAGPAVLAGPRALCFGASDFADEITAAILAQLLARAGHRALSFGINQTPVDVLEHLSVRDGDLICICALPPLAVMHARTIAKQVRARFPSIHVLVCLWGALEAKIERAQSIVAERIVISLTGAVQEIASTEAELCFSNQKRN